MKLESVTPEETKKLAQRLALRLGGGELITLIGPLGSGKTTFAQGLAEGLGSEVGASSPTFVLERRYPGRLELVHLDLYRLEDDREVEMMVGEAVNEESAVAVEWADRFPKIFEEKDRLEIRFKIGEQVHTLDFKAVGPRSRELVGDLE